MFANRSLGTTNFGVTDVASTPTPAGPVPMPFPNVSHSVGHIPTVMNAVVGGGLGGLDPMSFLSMMGGGEPDAAPAGAAIGASMAPSQLRVLMGG
jgi:hypothetical protein